MSEYKNKTIREWALEERPREKLITRGLDALTDAELIAILVSTGTHKHTALDLSRELIEKHGSLLGIATASSQELAATHGIGSAKAVRLMAAFELGRRKSASEHRFERFTQSTDAATYLTIRMADLRKEQFCILLLNGNNELIGEHTLSIGGLSATVIDPRIIFKEALNHLASAMIVAHNHPSGNPMPSAQDEAITKRLHDCAELLEIRLLDHIIVSRNGHYSFADHGFL